MRRRLLGNRRGVGARPAIDENGILYSVDSEAVDSYPGSGAVWTDLINGKQATIVGADYNAIDKTIRMDAQVEFWDLNGFSTNVEIPAGSDFTFSAFLRINSRNPFGNPGFWRNGSLGTGNTYNAFTTTTGRPDIRWNGTTILKPASGYEVPNGVFIYLSYVITSAGYAKFYANETEQYSVNHGVATPAFNITKLGFQSTNQENVFADYKSVQIYNRALSQSEIASNNTNLRNFYGL